MRWSRISFRVQPTAAELAEYRSAILFGYQKMDALLGRVLKMIDSNTIVVLASALSQQPCLAYEHQGGKAFYRPRTFERLFSFAGVRGCTAVAPVMAHQFHVELATPDAARAAADRLRALRVADRQALAVECNGNQVFAWCAITHAVESTARVETGDERGERAASFFSLFFKVDGIKSGMHHPDGLFWMRRPGAEHRRVDEPVELDRVAPTLLSELGIAPPATMRQDSVTNATPHSRESAERDAREIWARMTA